MKHLAVCGLLALLSVPALALEPYLVKDINPVPGPADHSNPSELVTLGDAVLFFAHDGVSRQLWRSDGTAGGTWLISEICQPQDRCFGTPQAFQVTERLYFFLATGEPDAGLSLWVTDGTAGGTLRLSDPALRIHPRKLWVASQGLLYFVAQDQDHGSELWRTDGTPAGTHLVADVRPGPEGSDVGGLVEYKGRLWFAANDGSRGGALWRTDGTPAGTVLALDPLPSSASNPVPQDLWAVGSRIAFFAPTSGRGEQIWAGDGTAKGTAPVSTLSRGKNPSVLLDAYVRGNRLYFIAADRKGQELWISDGTARGTRVLTNFPNPDAFAGGGGGTGPVYSILLPRQQPTGNRFVFHAHDGPHGLELWVTDGTPKGTRLLRDISPGANHGVDGVLEVFQGRLYFIGADGVRGPEIWSTDGTAAGTRRVTDICPPGCFMYHTGITFNLGTRLLFLTGNGQRAGVIWSTDGTAAGTVRVNDSEQLYMGPAAVLNGKLVFGLSDDLHGTEPWSTDGTVAGTQLVKDINQTDRGGSYPQGLHAFGDEVVFSAYDGAPGLWRSNGTEQGTTLIKTFGPGELGSGPGLSEVGGGRLFFFLGDVLWRTDGTEPGTIRLTGEGVGSCCRPEIRAVGDTAFFTAREAGQQNELWASDGTVNGTRRVRDIDPGELTAFQGKLFFSAETPESGRELWRSDGTEAGTVQVTDINPISGSDPTLLTVHAGRLWFFASDGAGDALWSSDGTAAGTRLEVDFEPGSHFFHPRFMVSLGSRLVVSGHTEGLWVSDGTPAGTRKIQEGEVDSDQSWTVFQGRLYYHVHGSAFGSYLWVTDGTEAGTGLLLDRDGKEIFPSRSFAHLGDRLLFLTAGSGNPVWETDGTPAGTFRLLLTGGGHDPSSELVRAGSRVFFRGYDRETGYELWAVRP